MSRSGHPDRQVLHALGQGRLPDTEVVEVERHVENCPECQQVLETVPDDAMISLFQRAGASPSSSPPLLRVVPGYEVLEELGRGGMGIVYRARQVLLNRFVALKRIHPGGEGNPVEVTRFRREAEAAARLRHPHIVQVYEIGEQDGQLYLAMELMEGGSLDKQLARGPLPPRQAAELVATLARAIQAAHEQGIIHRDLKPANILMSSDQDRGKGRGERGKPETEDAALLPPCPFPLPPGSAPLATPKITDFGLAKLLDDRAAQTQTGAILGTPSYMAPEQASGHPDRVGTAADVYALGAILYETLTGRPPFRAATILETLEQVRTREPLPPGQLQPGLPRDLQTICLKCLDKDPKRRYSAARDLADDLDRFLKDEPVQARPVPAAERLLKWARRRPALAALVTVSGLGLLVLVLGMVWYNARLREQVQRAETSEAEARRQQQRADDHYREARAALQRILAQLDDRKLADVPRLKELREHQLREALAFFRNILAEDGPLDPAVQADVASAFYPVGLIQNTLGLDQCADNFRQATALLEDLTARYPDEPAHQAALAMGYNSLGCTYGLAVPPQPQGEHYLDQALALREQLCRANPSNPVWQEALAESYHNLGHFRHERGQRALATSLFEQALAIRAALHQRFPQDRRYITNAATDCLMLGLCYMHDARAEKAEATYRQGVDLLQPLVHDHPQETDYAAYLAGLYANWAILESQVNQVESAVQLASQAILLAEEVLRKEPRHALAARFCRNAHTERAYVLHGLKRYGEAIKDWERAIELSEGNDRRRCQALRGWALAHGGAHARAMAAARELADDATVGNFFVMEAAKIMAFAGKAAADDANLPSGQRESMPRTAAVQVIALVKRLHQAGYFKDPDSVRQFKEEDAFQWLQGRPEFQQVQQDITKTK